MHNVKLPPQIENLDDDLLYPIVEHLGKPFGKDARITPKRWCDDADAELFPFGANELAATGAEIKRVARARMLRFINRRREAVPQ